MLRHGGAVAKAAVRAAVAAQAAMQPAGPRRLLKAGPCAHAWRTSGASAQVDGPHHFSVNPPFYPLGPTLARNRMLTADGYRARVARGGAGRSVHVENGACAGGCD